MPWPITAKTWSAATRPVVVDVGAGGNTGAVPEGVDRATWMTWWTHSAVATLKDRSSMADHNDTRTVAQLATRSQLRRVAADRSSRCTTPLSSDRRSGGFSIVAVHAVPDQNRHPHPPAGSGYQPVGGGAAGEGGVCFFMQCRERLPSRSGLGCGRRPSCSRRPRC